MKWDPLQWAWQEQTAPARVFECPAAFLLAGPCWVCVEVSWPDVDRFTIQNEPLVLPHAEGGTLTRVVPLGFDEANQQAVGRYVGMVDAGKVVRVQAVFRTPTAPVLVKMAAYEVPPLDVIEAMPWPPQGLPT